VGNLELYEHFFTLYECSMNVIDDDKGELQQWQSEVTRNVSI